MKSIRKWLEEDAGVKLSITSLTSYISRIRRRLATKQPPREAQATPNAKSQGAIQVPPGASPEGDPLAQAKRVLSRPKLDIRKLHNDGDPEGRNLI